MLKSKYHLICIRLHPFFVSAAELPYGANVKWSLSKKQISLKTENLIHFSIIRNKILHIWILIQSDSQKLFLDCQNYFKASFKNSETTNNQHFHKYQRTSIENGCLASKTKKPGTYKFHSCYHTHTSIKGLC